MTSGDDFFDPANIDQVLRILRWMMGLLDVVRFNHNPSGGGHVGAVSDGWLDARSSLT